MFVVNKHQVPQFFVLSEQHVVMLDLDVQLVATNVVASVKLAQCRVASHQIVLEILDPLHMN